MVMKMFCQSIQCNITEVLFDICQHFYKNQLLVFRFFSVKCIVPDCFCKQTNDLGLNNRIIANTF